jgi:dephospho-CoA kinase
MVLKVGISGGIGSGKTVVCEIFKLLGIPVFYADQVAKDLWNNNPVAKEKLIRLFGPDIYPGDNCVDRKRLASLIFNDEILLKKVNEIIHPIVDDEFLKWVALQKSDYVIAEAAILFESGFYKLMDYNILIAADKELRIKRVMERDSVAREKVLLRIDKQWDDNTKTDLADLVIFNNNELLIPEILGIDKKIKEHGKIW